MWGRKQVQLLLVFWVFQLFWLLERFSSFQPLRSLCSIGMLAFPWLHLSHHFQEGAFNVGRQVRSICQPHMMEIPSC